MKKYLLLIIAVAIVSNKTQAQSLGNITFSSCPPCGYIGLMQNLSASPIAGATAYHWFSTQLPNPSVLLDGIPLPMQSVSNTVTLTFNATQQFYTICVYATNACCTTDTACCIIPGVAPQPLMSPSNSPTAVPGSSGIYSVLPPLPQCVTGAFWSLIPASAGTITGNGNPAITVNFSPTFTTCLLCVHYQTTFNLNGPDTCMLINATVGINETANTQTAFSIYPNPAANNFELRISDFELNKKQELKIFDCLGKEVLKSEIRNSQSEINIQSLQSGMYFIEINGERKKFVKQNP